MKKTLLGAAAALAIAAPGAALAETSGYIDTGYETTEYDGGGDFEAFHLGGAIAHDFTNFGVQADARMVNQEWNWGGGDSSHGYAAVHAFTTTGSWDFGGFVGLIDYYGDAGKMIGAETRTSFGAFSLGGSLGYADFGDGNDYTATDLRVNGAYFINSNFAITGGVGHTDWNSWTDFDALDLSVGAAYQFSNAFTLYGEYVNTDGGGDGVSDWEADTFRIGLRFNINGGDLQNITNNGASWSGASELSEQMMRW